MGNLLQPFKYVGQFGVMAEPNGFYYMRARYYDPKVGRFVSEDPLGFGGGDVNLMAYVGGNPVNFVDPDGENALVVGGIVLGAGGYYLYTHSVSFKAFVDSVAGNSAPIPSPIGEVAGVALDPVVPTSVIMTRVDNYNAFYTEDALQIKRSWAEEHPADALRVLEERGWNNGWDDKKPCP